MTSTPLAALQPQRLGQALSAAALNFLCCCSAHMGGVVPPPLTNVSFESSVLVSSGVSLHSHPLPPSLCVFVCPPLPLPFHGVPLEDKKHPVCLDLAASKS